MDSPEW
jgi:hypothetical protein